MHHAAKVFQAIQGHWLSACLGVIMKLKIPGVLTHMMPHAQWDRWRDAGYHLDDFPANILTHAMCRDFDRSRRSDAF